MIDAYQGYRQFEVQKSELTASQLLLFLMITLLILLASSWVGLYLARRVTVPIQALADGTRRISDGDLAYRVEVEADDELGVLVDSFNRMTGELERNKQQLESGNLELTEANRRLGRGTGPVGGGAAERRRRRAGDRPPGRVLVCQRRRAGDAAADGGELRGRALAEAWADPERGELLRAVEEPRRGRHRLRRAPPLARRRVEDLRGQAHAAHRQRW